MWIKEAVEVFDKKGALVATPDPRGLYDIFDMMEPVALGIVGFEPEPSLQKNRERRFKLRGKKIIYVYEEIEVEEKKGPIAQLAEAVVSKAIKSRFKS